MSEITSVESYNSGIKRPLFSIVSICLNAGRGLQETVLSALGQSFGSIEVIVKDGGSSDNSVAALPRDARLQVITSSDAGIYDAMNQALDHVSGDYILFLNAGDIFPSADVLECVAQEIKRTQFPSLLYTDYTMKANLSQRYGQPPRLTGFTLFRNTLNHQTCYFHRSCYEQFGLFDVSYRIWGDYDFLLRAWMSKCVRAVHLPFVGVIYEGGGVSTRQDLACRALHEIEKARRRHFNLRQRTLFSILRACTFTWARNWAASTGRPKIVQRTYIWLRNLLYRIAA